MAYTYAYFFVAPYSGFSFDPVDGAVTDVYVDTEAPRAISEGDRLVQIGDISWTRFQSDSRLVLFEDNHWGDVVNVTVNRNGETIIVPWIIEGINPLEFRSRFINVWWLAFVFWAFGLSVQLFILPRDIRWRLLALANYMTGLWVIIASVSAWRIWESSPLFHALTWLLVPVYLQLHWVFPRSLQETSIWNWIVLYGVSIVLAVGEWMQAMPLSVYYLGYVTMLAGSVTLLTIHAIRQREQRIQVTLLGVTVLFALIPVILFGITHADSEILQIGPLALIVLPIVPGVYTYIVYRQRLGGMEVRANRLVSTYTFAILIGILFLFLSGIIVAISKTSPSSVLFFGVLAAGMIYLAIFPAYRAFIERRILGIKLPYQNLPRLFAARITTSTSMPKLLQLLEEDVFPSLLVRQFLFLQASNDGFRPILKRNVEEFQVPEQDDIRGLIPMAGHYLSLEAGQPRTWVRLILPLKVGEELLGLWLLGRRDPDSIYYDTEVPVFQSLSDQTAIAMSNLLQTERLQSLYQMDVERSEQERMHLALELHDSVLNELAILHTSLDLPQPSSEFEQAYDNVVTRLREIVSGLRPPMLNFGLRLALEGLVDDLADRKEDDAIITFEWQGQPDLRYPDRVEMHLYRIAQETCENAFRHAKAAHIHVRAGFNPEDILITVEDDGVGFPLNEHSDLNDLLAHRHFGLAGIVERARFIGAQASIRSSVQGGTRVQVTWNAAAMGPAEAAPDPRENF